MAFLTAIAVMLFGLISSISGPAACASSAASMTGILLSNSIVKPIADGTTFERMTALTSAGWIQMSVIRVDLSSSDVAVGPVLADGVLTSPKSITSIAEEADLVAAINGDFFDIGATSAPLSLLVADGQIIRSPRKDSDFASLVICEDGTGLIRQWAWKGVLKGPNGVEITLAGLNEISVPADLAVLYDHHWSWKRRPGNSDVHHIAIRGGVVESYLPGWPAPTSSVAPGGVNESGGIPGDQRGIVDNANSYADANAEAPELSDDELIYVVLRGHSAQIAQKLSPGDPVSIEGALAPPISGILSAFSGKPVLVEDGAVVPGLWKHTGIQSLFVAPRTAVGLTEDRSTLIMAVVDGRLPGARGVTLKELAEIMISLGTHQALNLDGGGSSTAAVQDLTTGNILLANRPSGGSQRRVPYAIGVWNTASQAAGADSESDVLDNDGPSAARSRIPAFISVSVESERPGVEFADLEGAGSDDIPDRTHLGSFPSIEAAVTGGPAFLAGPEVSLDMRSNVILTATVYDSSGRPMDPDDMPDGVEIVWEVTPPKNLRGIPFPEELWSVSEDSLSAVLFCGTPGRFDITVKAVEAEQAPPAPASEGVPPQKSVDDSSPLAQTGLAVRTIDKENGIVPMATGASAEMVSEAGGYLALVEDFEGPVSWVGAASSPSVGCIVEAVSTETSESECPRPAVSQAGNLLDPAGMALAIDYDLRAPEHTRAAYIRPPHPAELPIGASTILMWVHGDGGGHWLRATIRDSHGKEAPIDFPRIDWVGWRVVEASIPVTLVPPLYLVQVYVVEFKPELQSAGRIAIDNISSITAHTGPCPTDQDIDKLVSSATGRHVVRIDAARRPLPWHDILAEFEAFKASDEIELVVLLQGPNAVDIDSLKVEEGFRDPLEAELLLEILKGLADGGTSIVLVQDAPANSMPATGSNMEAFIDGVQVIWRKSELEADNGSAF